MRKITGTLALALIAVMTLMVSAPTYADEGAIKYRKSIMKAIGGHMGAMSGILKGEVPYKADLAGHAHAMAELAKSAAKAFPEGSDEGKTGALPEIWMKPEEFKEITAAFIAESQKLAEVSKSGDMGAFGAQFGKMAKASCKSCHDSFRQKNK